MNVTIFIERSNFRVYVPGVKTVAQAALYIRNQINAEGVCSLKSATGETRGGGQITVAITELPTIIKGTDQNA